MNQQHQGLAAGRWRELSLCEQMGNIGSEVSRAISWSERRNVEYSEKAFIRMLELLDLTLADERWRGLRRKEIARVREVICDSFNGGLQFGSSLAAWNNYFLPFAIAARAKK